MTTEQKAKAYDEALKRAREWHNDSHITIGLKGILEDFFPELKENEDEKIRKAMIKGLSSCASKYWGGFEIKAAIAWLEKQGEQKPVNVDYISGIRKELLSIEDNAENINGLTESQWVAIRAAHRLLGEYIAKEQKSADKIEPKFHEGDWVAYMGTIAKILDLQKHCYVGKDTNDKDFVVSYCNEYAMKKWDISYAKDGDVLDANGAPFIYKKHDKDYVYFYCGVNLVGEFIEANGIDTWNSNNKVYPATKEQRDTLMKAMTDAGWEFDFEKKELKKIEQKPTNENLTDVGHEYYSELLSNDDSDNIDDYAYQCAYCMSHDWMKETATWEDVQKAVKLGAEWQRQKSAVWSEEDEDAIGMAIIALGDMYDPDDPDNTYVGYSMPFNKAVERLKSLKPQKQWKPSKGQLECLGYAIDKAEKDYSPLANNRIYLTLKALKKELEKLTE